MTLASPPPIRIVAAVARDGERILTVLKRGTSTYMLPGGKLETGESEQEALARELIEELGTGLAGPARLIGRFTAVAANETDRLVDATVFAVTLAGRPQALAEIAEIRWVDAARPGIPLAPLLAEHVLPALARH